MTTKADLGDIIYHPPIASLFIKSIRILHLSATFLFLIFSLIEILLYYNYRRGLLLFLIFIIGLILSIVYPSGILTVHRNGFDRNISLFTEKVVGQPRYLKFNEITKITPRYQKQDKKLFIRGFIICYGKSHCFQLPLDLLFSRKYTRKIIEHFPEEWNRLYHQSLRANEVNWNLALNKIPPTGPIEDLGIFILFSVVPPIIIIWILYTFMNVTIPAMAAIWLVMAGIALNFPILLYLSNESYIVCGYLSGLVNNEVERRLIPPHVVDNPMFLKWMNKNLVKEIQTYEEVDAIIGWK